MKGGSVTAVSLQRGAADERGTSFTLAAEHLSMLAQLGATKDIHVASILPGHVRGNHYHATRSELILVIHEDRWSLRYDAGEATKVSGRAFTGAGVVAVSVPPLAAHALRNDGERILWLLAASDGPYDAADPDAHRRVLIDS
jgi:dTDP-4-dehydrorhamnose 3,5-epimerase-like enzyme